MGFVKVVKNKSYFRRFQVKYRRRRESKTDYYARKRLITQDKNKYKTPKYRLVVRVTNRDVITQIISADLTHDVVLAAAYAHELPRYGIKLGLTNYAACYATGLLLARRVNAKFGLNYEGNTDVNGEEYHVEADEEGAAPFKALLDVGLARTTNGARVFGALKGASDGGLNVPHSEGRFPGVKQELADNKTPGETHRKYIYGLHVSEYMKQLEEENEELYNKQFKRYIEQGIKPDSFEAMYKAAHAAIRKEPTKARAATELGYFGVRKTPKTGKEEYPKKYFNKRKISLKQRQARITQKLKARGINSIKGQEA